MPKERVLSPFEDALLDSLLEQVVVIDVDGNIRWANDAWMISAKLRGADPDSVSPGVNYLRVLEDSAEADFVAGHVLEGIKGVLAGSIQYFEEEYECGIDGEFRHFVERVTPLKHPEGGAVIAHLDITRQKNAERERDSQRLQLARAASAAALGQLSGAIAHEVSQPLSAILSNTQYALAALEQGAPTAEIVSALEDVEREVQRSGAILGRIHDLLGHSRARSEVVDINSMIKGTLTLCERQLHTHDIRLELSLPRGLPQIHGDSVGLQQVILNLVINAYEAMNSTEGNERRLSISTAEASPDHVVIEVSDTGPGLTEDSAGRLYEPLFTTKPDGTGLGLPISRSIVSAHGGTLSISNGSSGGVVGRIELPVKSSASSA